MPAIPVEVVRTNGQPVMVAEFDQTSAQGGGPPLSTEFFLDATTGVDPALQNGNVEAPFATLLQARDATLALGLPPGSNVGWRLTAGGTYDAGPGLEPPDGIGVAIASPGVAAVTGTFIKSTGANQCALLFNNCNAGGATFAQSGGAAMSVAALGQSVIGTIDDTDTTTICSIFLGAGSVWQQSADMTRNQWAVAGSFCSISSASDLGGLASSALLWSALNCSRYGTAGGAQSLFTQCNFSESIVLTGGANIVLDAESFASLASVDGTFDTGPVGVIVSGLPSSSSFQAVAATATDCVVGSATVIAVSGSHPVKVARVDFSSLVVPAAGESMTVDVRVIHADGSSASLLAAPLLFNSGSPLGVLPTMVADPTLLLDGDGIEVVRTYVPGGTPAMTSTNVTVYTDR